MITIWSPAPRTIHAAEFVDRVGRLSNEPAEPFSDQLVQLLAIISSDLLRSSVTRALPQYVALGYWMRAAALRTLAKDARSSFGPHEIAAPRGLALHLPPANVDTIFVYSWALSVLAGNVNVVRLPASLSSAAAAAVRIIVEALNQAGAGNHHLFCSYPYGSDLEHSVSSLCDLRIIWGGDAKIEAVSRVPIRPDGLSIGFSDRHSIALIAAHAYAEAAEDERDELASKLFNDAYWFDQMGCSSPRLLGWVGAANDVETFSKDLYPRLESVIESKSYTVEPAVAVAKLVLTNDLLAEGSAQQGVRYSNELQVVDVANPTTSLERHGGGGFFSQSRFATLADAAAIATRKLQTITHFGFSDNELTDLAKAIVGRGGYRIVPIGQALNFDATWDGVPLLSHMTRRVVVRIK
jgi:hypothetical protein